ncbi:hypothetical protein [Bacillus thuringiensis]|uniref:hypothetical protein n=1 Tax=Bacillus thuringiensis TaxID=1428 RepID=UPI0015CF7AFE|nr:hypothetical protein [Bacillus thuringiensis]
MKGSTSMIFEIPLEHLPQGTAKFTAIGLKATTDFSAIDFVCQKVLALLPNCVYLL